MARQIPIYPSAVESRKPNVRFSAGKEYNPSWKNSGKRQDKTVCMTIDHLEFDGDSHESSAHWFGMTVLFDALTFLYKFQFIFLLSKSLC